MDDVKYALICGRSTLADEWGEKATKAMEDRGYIVKEWPNNMVKRLKSELSGAGGVNLEQFLFGMNILLMSACHAVYFPKDCMDDNYMKNLHFVAFRYGMDIVIEE